MTVKQQQNPTLGQYLDQARKTAGYSMRQLSGESNIPLVTLNRILKDEVAKHNAEHLGRLGHALELNIADLFLLAGLPVPGKAASIEAVLRTEYDLPEAAIAEAREQIDSIVRRYKRDQPTES